MVGLAVCLKATGEKRKIFFHLTKKAVFTDCVKIQCIKSKSYAGGLTIVKVVLLDCS